ncbi:MAG TPA: heavy metal-binding domain-containing protein [Terriglobia bacterium]|nr:heavy metal-binding domain-containing protein [Terriglobia bacterium]
MIRTWIAGIVAVALASSLSAALLQNSPQAPVRSANEETAFLCPMHPDFTLDVEGKCPRCGMALVRAAAYDVRDYKLEFRTIPPVVVAGRKATLRFKVSHPGFNAVIEKFEVVHDRKYHLFVISQNMEYFEHIHPEQRADGTWTIDVTLPKPGYYKVLSDFLPTGGSTQFIARPLVTAGYAGDLAGDRARLVPDTVFKKSVEDLTAEVSFDPPTFVAGLYGHLNFRLSDTATGKPVTDLQPYLGAFGHTLIMSEDMVDYVHSHPVDISAVDESGPKQFMLPADVDPETLRGGPEVTFEGLMPKPGRYRAWTQFRRNGKLYTFSTTFNAGAAE